MKFQKNHLLTIALIFIVVYVYGILYVMKDYIDYYQNDLQVNNTGNNLIVSGIIEDFKLINQSEISQYINVPIETELCTSDLILVCIVIDDSQNRIIALMKNLNSPLLRQGQRIIMRGISKFGGKIFVADAAYLKHDETYKV